MKEISRGICQLGRDLKNPTEMPIVAVHPFYRDIHSFSLNDKLIRKYIQFEKFLRERSFWERVLFKPGREVCIDLIPQGNYPENMKSFIGNYNGAVIVLDDTKTLNSITLPVFEGFKERRGRYFIPTSPDSPTPLRVPDPMWENVAKFILPFGEEIALFGGQLYDHGKEKYSGCLGHTYYELKKNGLDPKFIRGCCFI